MELIRSDIVESLRAIECIREAFGDDTLDDPDTAVTRSNPVELPPL
jgi:hypothetical protein